jgi:hypothetical protein
MRARPPCRDLRGATRDRCSRLTAGRRSRIRTGCALGGGTRSSAIYPRPLRRLQRRRHRLRRIPLAAAAGGGASEAWSHRVVTLLRSARPYRSGPATRRRDSLRGSTSSPGGDASVVVNGRLVQLGRGKPPRSVRGFRPSTVRELRERRGWSLAQLGQEIGVSRAQVWQWEDGRSVPTPHNSGRVGQAAADRSRARRGAGLR